MNRAGLNSRRVEPPPMGELTTEIHINVDEIGRASCRERV